MRLTPAKSFLVQIELYMILKFKQKTYFDKYFITVHTINIKQG